MSHPVFRWAIYGLAVLVLGPLAGWLTGMLSAIDGGTEATPLLSASPARGVGVGVIAWLIAMGTGLAAARYHGVGPAYTAAGLVLAWAAWGTAQVDELIRTAQSARPLFLLACEGTIFGALSLGGAVAIARLAGFPGTRASGQAAVSPDVGSGTGHGHHRLFVRGMAAIGAGFLSATVVAWLVAASPLKGQSLAATIFASAAGAAAARLTDPFAAPPLLLCPALLLGLAGPLSGLMVIGGDAPDVIYAAYRDMLLPTANPVPFDWLAGAFLGMPLGSTWADSILHRHADS